MEKQGRFHKLKARLKRTRDNMMGGLNEWFRDPMLDDEDFVEELETRLLMADLGVMASQELIQRLKNHVGLDQPIGWQRLHQVMAEQLAEMLTPWQRELTWAEQSHTHVILMVGVNGVGKTTTIAKMAKRFQSQGKSVMLAAGDTFRAAAVEQLQQWGARHDIPVVAQSQGSDAAAVAFDALQSARAKGINVLIIDTAGRLHTQSHLMEELAKIRRVLSKVDPTAPHDVLLTVDAGAGQNALNQARQFHASSSLTGVVLTKLDGTAKGGVVCAIACELQLPICFIGIGEQADDLRPFDAHDFAHALLASSEDSSAG